MYFSPEPNWDDFYPLTSISFLWHFGKLFLEPVVEGGSRSKEPACQCRRSKRCGFHPWVGKIPWRRAWQPTPVFLPGESHGWRGLAGYSPWGRRVGHHWSNLARMHMHGTDVKMQPPARRNIKPLGSGFKTSQKCAFVCVFSSGRFMVLYFNFCESPTTC